MSAFSSLFSGAKVDENVDQLLKKAAGPVARPLAARTEIIIPEVEETQQDPVLKVKKKNKKKKALENANLKAELLAKALREPESAEKEKDTTEDTEKPEISESSQGAEDVSDNNKSAAKEAKSIDLKDDELSKAERTVFVGNVSTRAITSKSVYEDFKKTFSNHGKVQSIRFRSISFAGALPRKVAFIQKNFNEVRDTVNAYVVFEEKEPSLKCVSRLNGTVFEDNHIRVDHLAHPSPKDNKRTIFVGNLDFEEKEERLWRYFNEHTDDDVEAVRVVRDSKTNFGKGFALVQFKDTLSVNKALLLNDKPMPNLEDEKKTRKLRITRAKSTVKPSVLSPNHFNNQKKPRRANKPVFTDDQKTKIGRAKKLLGNADRSTVGTFVAEGARASKGQRIAGIKGLKSAKGRVKKPRVTKRSAQFKSDKKAFQNLK